jgi:sugar O-acyltransferase (sialic acid O-acetyltransferase NeuD family)
MNGTRSVILVGAFIEIIELCEALNLGIAGVVENARIGSILGHPILGADDQAAEILQRFADIPIHITPDSPNVRSQLTAQYLRLGASFASLVHPAAYVAPSAAIGQGVAIQARAHISSASVIGRGVKVNTCANITHDVNIEEFATVAPSAVLLGRVHVGARAYIGANATILPGISVGTDAIVGAGATVTHDVPPGGKVIGLSARPL